MHPGTGAVGGPGLNVKLDIRRRHLGPRAQERQRKAGGHRHGAGAEQRVFRRDPGLAEEAAHLVVQRGLMAFIDQPRLQMVLQVAPHIGRGDAGLNPLRGQHVRVANA